MDEYDEEMYNRELKAWESAREQDILYLVPLRLLEREEERFRASNLYLLDKEAQKAQSNGDFAEMFFTPYGATRFYRTVIGFHTGKLDLRGRFKPRYDNLIIRWQRFSEELRHIKEHSTSKQVELMFPDGRRLCDVVGGEPQYATEVEVHPQELLDTFCTRWHLIPKFLDLDALFKYKESDEERAAFMRHNVELSYAKFAQRLTALRNTPDALHRMRTLFLANALDLDITRLTGTTHEEYLERLRPLIKPVKDIVARSPGISECTINAFPLHAPLLATILTLPHLLTITLRKSILDTRSRRLPRCDTVLNALLGPSAEDNSIWNVLPSLTSLRWLYIDGSGGQCQLPSPAIRRAANVFTTLERLTLTDIPFDQLEFLTDWIRQAQRSRGPGLRLTHFKLEMRWGLSEQEILDILSALQGAPMKVFVIDGISDAEPTLFDAIANAFPRLESLTLVYRDSDRQVESKEAEWPHATWEYAPHFAGFTHLKHFGWNWKLGLMQPAPSCMLLFESDYALDWMSITDRAADEFFDDWDVIPRLFHAYCPTLESFYFVIKGLPFVRYRIRQEDGKGLQVQLMDLKGGYGDEHNPPYWKGWPKFTQKRST
ncbi:hypothetical protein EIP86_002780 [Pleurotus ostreatoroseus]|nr:hypothetical protein EIP86_002780 [Pleurotus ostreatoroseus]